MPFHTNTITYIIYNYKTYHIALLNELCYHTQ